MWPARKKAGKLYMFAFFYFARKKTRTATDACSLVPLFHTTCVKLICYDEGQVLNMFCLLFIMYIPYILITRPGILKEYKYQGIQNVGV